MVKLAARPKAQPKGVIRSKHGRKPDTVTYNLGAGFSREPKSELFLLAVTNMVSENTFYESGKNRDERFAHLIRQVALEDPDWIARFIPYLRNTMNMRSASVVMAAELVHAKLTQPVPASKISNRSIIDSAIVRADEPAELLGYWMSEWGKHLPQPVKRGLSDAAQRVYSERNLIKYDGGDKPIRFADVIELVHAEPKAPWQSALFKYAIDNRHKRDNVTYGGEDGELLKTLANNAGAMALKESDFRAAFTPEFVERCGLTWEQSSSKYGKLDAKFWEAMIPNMGIFAIVRNLRNFDEASIPEHSIELARTKLKDPEVIRKSRMFPLRFFTALVATQNYRWAEALEVAIDHATSNVPALTGKTLILVDVSGSMDAPMSAKSDVKRLAPASIFGAALAVRAEHPTLAAFSDSAKEIHVAKSASVLALTKDIVDSMPHSGTNTWGAVQSLLSGHDRVVIITDEQSDPGYSDGILGDTRLYTFNLAGYRAGHAPSGKKGKYTFGGLSDAGFTAIELLEKGNDEAWPF